MSAETPQFAAGSGDEPGASPDPAVGGRHTLPDAAWVAVVSGLAWVGLGVVTLTGATGHVAHDELLGPHHHGAVAPGVAAFLAMWGVMVVAMMRPLTLVPRDGVRRGGSWVARGVVADLTVWGGFAALALAGDAVLHRLVESGTVPEMVEAALPALVLVTAGAYQVTPLKRRTLSAGRTAPGALQHATACLGGCWALMLVMFALGMESLVLMVALTVLMCVERARRRGDQVAALAGLVLMAAGLSTALT